MKAMCIKKCFVGGRLWTPGETMNVESEKDLPKHFAIPKKATSKEKKAEKSSSKKAVEALGHKKGKADNGKDILA